MGHDGAKLGSAGQITSGIETTLVAQTLAFVRRQLPKWRDDPNRSNEQAENRLNAQLCKFLEACARSEFPMVCFAREEPQPARRQVDMAATPAEPMIIGVKQYTIYEPFLVFEGKRLPTPGSNREREYVTGFQETNGGIQRFKLSFHGPELDVAAIIGYLQARSAADWHRDINQWIEELARNASADACVWQAADSLGELTAATREICASCQSTHNRTGSGTPITLHHLWIEMTPTTG